MRKDQCKFCTSRSCYVRIYTDDLSYDEVACNKHIIDLEKHSDRVLGRGNGVMRTHVTGTSKKKRGKMSNGS
jgi:hypothetical protein